VISFATAAGLAVVLGAAAILVFLKVALREKLARSLRPIAAFQRLQRAIGLAVEDGKRLHVSLGKSEILSPDSASSLVGLTTLERIAQLSMISDRPPIATSGQGSLSVLSQDTLRAGYRASNALEQYDPDRGRLAGPTPLSYTAATIAVIHDENFSAHLLVGSFGPEVGLLTEAIDQENAFSLAATNSLPAQAVLYATAQEPLIGEELFAVPGYLHTGPIHTASLLTQDVLRWLFIVSILVGCALKMIGII
jgi:hypothetical protein